jgi:hypothetical protein
MEKETCGKKEGEFGGKLGVRKPIHQEFDSLYDY